MTPSPDQYPVLDGFQFASKLRCNLTFRALAIQQFEALRRSGGFRNKTFCIPQDSTIKIPAYGSYERQVWVPAGSVIWGYSFSGETGQTNGSQSWEVRDSCDDIPVFSEVVTRRMAALNPIPVLGVNSNAVPQQILSKLLVVGPPGILNVVICNTYGTDQVGQLVLYGGVPFDAR